MAFYCALTIGGIALALLALVVATLRRNTKMLEEILNIVSAQATAIDKIATFVDNAQPQDLTPLRDALSANSDALNAIVAKIGE